MRQKGFALIFLLVVVVALSLVGAFYLGKGSNNFGGKKLREVVITPSLPPLVSNKPTPDTNSLTETANWKVYTSQKYKFSFKYPENWYVLDQAEQWGTVYINKSPLENPDMPRTHGVPSALQISIVTNPQEIVDYPYGKRVDMEIDGVSGDKVISQTPSPNDGVLRTWIVLNSSPVRLELVFPNTNTQGDHDVTFDKILSTFKFTQ